MKEVLTKKLIVIVSVITVIVVSAVLLAVTTGNTNYPALSDPDGIFYQRFDDEGNVLYTITNEELFEQIKANDGASQLMYYVDSLILAEYIDTVTQAEINDKILELTYGTSDPEEIAEYDADKLEELEIAFEQALILAGFEGEVDDYAKLLVAREKYVREYADSEGTITERAVALEYLNNYWADISAIRIRFTSSADAEHVMNKFNLVSLATVNLREYNGYYFDDETLVDPDEEIVEAYIPVEVYYFNADKDNDIYDAEEDVIYERGANDIYTDEDDYQYNIDGSGNLVNGLNEIVIPADHLFDTLEEALEYQEENTVYFTVTRTDPYDMTEIINVLDSEDNVVYTIDEDQHIWDSENNDVTYTTDLVVNKIYAEIEDVDHVTSNNSSELSEEELLQKFILMYNYVYGEYRDELPEGSDVDELIALDSEYLTFNYEEEYDELSTLASYMFEELSIEDENVNSESPEKFGDYYYLVYKLSEGSKEDIMETIFDYLAPLVVIPTVVADDIDLPTSTYYNGSITWSSSDAGLITSSGVVSNPDEDDEVELTYTMTVLGEKYSDTITVTVLAEGETEEVEVPTWEEVSLEEIVNDPTVYSRLYNFLLDEYVYGSSSSTNIDSVLAQMRKDLGFQIYDRYIGMDYQGVDSSFTYDAKGNKTIFASLEKTLTSEDPVEITADEFYEYAVSRNAALYTLYASQYKELIYTTYFEDIFGTQRDLRKNKSDRMDEMFDSIANAKSYYIYLEQLYAQYGMSSGYASFSDYSYSQYGSKTELALLQYFVSGEIQPYLIDEIIREYGVVEALYDTVQEYYDNYFSLYASHLLIYLDFDEDGTPDDYYEYKDSLTTEELADFLAMQARLETAIDEFDGTFSELISEFNNATRDDETWGEFKQNGFFIMTESLNQVDDDDVEHSLTYVGEYGVKDLYVEEFVNALIMLYQEYQLDQNLDKDELYSDLVETEFGIHMILATQGEDFDHPSCEFEEEDSDNPEYSVGSENENAAPTLAQMELYTLYIFYAQVYDLSDADIEETYGITIPEIPSSVDSALDFYLGDLIQDMYVRGTININMAARLIQGEFVTNDYTDLTDSQLMTNLDTIETIYFDAILGDYIAD